MDVSTIIKLAVAAVTASGAFILRANAKKNHTVSGNLKKYKKAKTISAVILIICIWYFVGVIISQISGGFGNLNVKFKMFAPRIILFGISFSTSTALTWIIIICILIFSLIFRFIIFPRFSENPEGFQNIIELAIEAMDNFTNKTTGNLSPELPAYMFSIAVFLLGSAASELFGQRPPTADITMTFSLALLTLFLINFYGIRKKGFIGRIKALSYPSPVILPIKMLSDCAIPVSLSCRLFGNMLGGMIVMDLLKSSLGGYSIGLTALAGIYFNLFHPLIQAYIFIILSLTFINEAAE